MKLLLFIFGCHHSRLTWPQRSRQTRVHYVCCLDCGREFAYDWAGMRRGPELRRGEPALAAARIAEAES